MKKKFFLYSFIFFSLIILFGCNKINFSDYISEERKNLFIGKSSNFVASFTSGKREDNYVMDGKNSNLVDFGVLTIKFSKGVSLNPQFELKVNDEIFAGELEKNPYDSTFVYDIKKQVNDDDIISLYIVDFDESIELNSLSKDFSCDSKKALSIFEDKFKDQIKNNDFEIYIKIVSDDEDLKNIYWYVLLVDSSSNTYSCLIDVKTCEILQS